MPKTLRFALFLAALAAPITAFGQPVGELLLVQDFSEIELAAPAEVKVVSFNLRGPPTGRIEDVFRVLESAPALRDAHVFLLQEVNRDHAGSADRDVGLELAKRLKTHYAYAVESEHGKGGGVRGLAILSRFPLEDTRRIQLPVQGPGGRRRIALGSTLRLGATRVRLYNLHLETRISAASRGEQIGSILNDAAQFSSLPTILAGDFNTITAAATQSMFQVMEEAGFVSALPGNQITFERFFLIRMVLDWIWGRNISILEAGVASQIRVSDHRPLSFKFALER